MPSKEVNLSGGCSSITFNHSETVGAMALDGLTTNQSRRTLYNPEYLKEWAEMVYATYGSRLSVEVIFTPEMPMVAVKDTDKTVKMGIGVAPRVRE